VKVLDVISIFKKANDTEERLDIQEAFNIYNLLRARYFSTQTVQLYKSFVNIIRTFILASFTYPHLPSFCLLWHFYQILNFPVHSELCQ